MSNAARIHSAELACWWQALERELNTRERGLFSKRQVRVTHPEPVDIPGSYAYKEFSHSNSPSVRLAYPEDITPGDYVNVTRRDDSFRGNSHWENVGYVGQTAVNAKVPGEKIGVLTTSSGFLLTARYLDTQALVPRFVAAAKSGQVEAWPIKERRKLLHTKKEAPQTYRQRMYTPYNAPDRPFCTVPEGECPALQASLLVEKLMTTCAAQPGAALPGTSYAAVQHQHPHLDTALLIAVAWGLLAADPQGVTLTQAGQVWLQAGRMGAP